MASGLIISLSPSAGRARKPADRRSEASRGAKPRRETLRPLLEALVDRGLIGRALLPLWVRTYPTADGVTLEWLNRVVAERKALRREDEEEVPE